MAKLLKVIMLVLALVGMNAYSAPPQEACKIGAMGSSGISMPLPPYTVGTTIKVRLTLIYTIVHADGTVSEIREKPIEYNFKIEKEGETMESIPKEIEKRARDQYNKQLKEQCPDCKNKPKNKDTK